MKIHGILSWYDESPSWLGTATASLGRFCDHVLAIDGAYALYPEGKPKSHPIQVETILHTAEAAGVGCTIHQPQEVWWGNEVEKRNKALDIVRSYAEEDVDWLCIFDADYHVVHCQPDSIRHELANTDCDVATYGIIDSEDWLNHGGGLGQQSNIATQWVSHTRDLYRCHSSLLVGPAHGDYSRISNSKWKQVWLRGPYDLEPAHDISGFLKVYHRTKDRVQVRRNAQKGYYQMRDSLGIENQELVSG